MKRREFNRATMDTEMRLNDVKEEAIAVTRANVFKEIRVEAATIKEQGPRAYERKKNFFSESFDRKMH